MDVAKMIEEFGIRYTSEINLAVPGWENIEILSWLNNAQRDITDNLYRESSEQELYELLRIITPTDMIALVPQIRPVSNTEYYELETKGERPWRFFSTVHAGIARTDMTTTGSHTIKARPIDVPIAESLILTPFNKPYFRELYYYFTEEDFVYTPALSDPNNLVIVFLKDFFTTIDPLNMEVRYIKEPATMVEGAPGSNLETNTCELHERHHDAVVDRAVTLAIEALNNPRVATQPQVTQT